MILSRISRNHILDLSDTSPDTQLILLDEEVKLEIERAIEDPDLEPRDFQQIQTKLDVNEPL